MRDGFILVASWLRIAPSAERRAARAPAKIGVALEAVEQWAFAQSAC